MAQINSVLAKAVYRGILKGSRALEDSPALKAILRNDAEILPYTFRRILNVYFGMKDFYIPVSDRKYDLVDRVKQGANLLRDSTTIEESLHVLRFINEALEKGRKYQLLGSRKASGSSNRNVELVTEPSRGVVLIAHPMLTGWFKRSVVFLLSHTEESSVGLCINKPLSVTLRDIQLMAKSALSNAKKGEKTISLHIENYGDVRFSAEVGSSGDDLLIPSKRLVSLEATASYRQAMKDAQEEARSLHDNLLKKKLTGMTLEDEENETLTKAEKFLQHPLTISDTKVEYQCTKAESEENDAYEESSDDEVEDLSTTSPQSPVTGTRSPETGADKTSFQSGSVLNMRISNGGPVQAIGALHNISSLSGVAALPGINYSEERNLQIWKHQAKDPLSEAERIRLFLGECTWSEGQLADEVKQGCWIMCKATNQELDLLNGDVRLTNSNWSMWNHLLDALGEEYADLARIPYELPEVL